MMRSIVTCLGILLYLPMAWAQQPDTTQSSVEQYIEQDESSLSLDSIVVRNVVYDPNTNTYTIEKLVDGQRIAPPVVMTQEEYRRYRDIVDFQNYIRNRERTRLIIEGADPDLLAGPVQSIKNDRLQRILGSIDIRPSGNLELTLGGNVQRFDNPNLPQRAQVQGGPDFDMNINMNVTGKIGDYLQMGLRYNNQTGFSFDNQVNLQYNGKEDNILRQLEIGNTSFETPTQLITGAQSLFGVKAQLQFGRLTMTNVVSQQRSQKQSIVVEDGAQVQNFELRADQYEADRHFFLSDFFRNNYERALSQMPNILSQATVEELEVWITNRNNATQNVRDVVAFMDMGEISPYSSDIQAVGNNTVPDNGANDLYSRLTANVDYRRNDQIINVLQSGAFNLDASTDYEKIYARKLNPSEYTLEPNLGYISLNTTLQPNQVLAVAYKYNYNGQVYQVGELSRNVPPDSSSVPKVLYLKLLKSTTQSPRLPTWDLMMKNVYSLGAFQISPDDFRLDIFYIDPGGGLRRTLPEGSLSETQLIQVVGLDNLNNQGDPQPDGRFDFQPGLTINPSNGRITFPVLEPFGQYLEDRLNEVGDNNLVNQYVYNELYDSTLFIAKQFPEKNRFTMRGRYQGSGGNRISLGAFQIPQNSVTVSLGGQQLIEGTHYTVDYNLGAVTIIDDAILNSGQQVKIDFENNALFGFQQRNLFATRLDYRVNDQLFIGGTLMKMTERPFTQKVNIGDDPISNTIYGIDFRYTTDAPWLTKALDKLPIYSTSEMSTIDLAGEAAYIRPGNNRFVGKGEEATVYVDDFEGTTSSYELKFPANAWRHSSVPTGNVGSNGQELFTEGSLNNDIRSNFNRAKMAWYNIDPSFFDNGVSPSEVYDNKEVIHSHFVRPIFREEICPACDLTGQVNTQVSTLDLAFYPEERGVYNFESSTGPTVPFSRGVNPDGRLLDPETRWGGLMRGIDNTNFEAANVEYIEFWLLDPFVYDDTRDGGDLYFNLGNLSEDVLKDSRMLYEHGLSDNDLDVDSTYWGKVPRTPPIVNSFDNNADLRSRQDVGFDGLNDDEERVRRQDALGDAQINLDPQAFAAFESDPASDNYQDFWNLSGESSILKRYKNFNGPDGNSPIVSGDARAGTNIPDQEDLNRDNALNETEGFFAYRVPLFPDMSVENHPYIVSSTVRPEREIDGVIQPEAQWYQFRVPVREFDQRVGNIADFRSIQFMRMFLTNWNDSVILRFASMELVRNQWATYQYELSNPTENLPIDEEAVSFNVTSVNIEENGGKEPVNYVTPPGIVREQGIGQGSGTNLVLQNEQAIAATVCGLKDGDARAVFKTLDLDMRNYKRLVVDVHANRFAQDVADPPSGALTAFLRLGSDFKQNYYEYEVPLEFTPEGRYDDVEGDRSIVWPDANRIEVVLQDLVNAKIARNQENYPFDIPYTYVTDSGRIVTIKGTPDLGLVQIAMLGIRNPSKSDVNNPRPEDAGEALCGEVWFNEFRLKGFDERGGGAALGSIDVKLADLGTASFSANMHGIGFGQVEQRVDQRLQDKYFQYNFTTSLELGRFLPVKSNIRIPFFANISQSFSTPEYDPYQFDIFSADQVDAIRATSSDSANTYLRQIQTTTTRKGFNFTNVRKLPGENQKRLYVFSPENIALTYAYSVIEDTDPFTRFDRETNHRATFAYNYAMQPKSIKPFAKMIKAKTKYLDLIKKFNFNPLPTQLGFTTTMDRKFGELAILQLPTDEFVVPSSFNKFFTWSRNYVFQYNPFESMSINYQATNNARIDEPDGRIDTDEERRALWSEIRQGGRNTNFNQSLGLTYKVPINLIPAFDFVNLRTGYNSTFNWVAAPQIRNLTGGFAPNTLGNTMNNSQDLSVNGDLNMLLLYNKSPYLKKFLRRDPAAGNKEELDKKRDAVEKAKERIDKDLERLKDRLQKSKEALKTIKADTSLTAEERPKKIKEAKASIKSFKQQIRKRKKDRRKQRKPANFGENISVQPLLMVRRVSATYRETRSTLVAGYMPSTSFFGQDRNFKSPGYDFVFGGQPGFMLGNGFDPLQRDQWIENMALSGNISTDTLLNQKFAQNYLQSLDFRATLEPWRDLQIDLTMNRSFSQNHSQLFKTTTGFEDDFAHYVPADIGSFTVSTISWKTMFQQFDDNWVNESFTAFLDNRAVISDRLAAGNPNSNGVYVNPSDTINGANPGFNEGYGPVQQDVLIPAFLAAYQSKDARTIGLNPLRALPKPNWKITYNGLSRFPWAKDIFSNFSISHGYQSTVTINSFQTNFDYNGNGSIDGGSTVDSLNGNFFTLYTIPNLIINEQLNPLIGVDMTFKNGIIAKVDYKSSRTLTMNFSDYQMIENRTSGFTVGLGYKIKGLTLNWLKFKGKRTILHNDLNFRFDLSVRDQVTVNHLIDQGQSRPTAGSRIIAANPSIDYVINKQLNIRIFLNRQKTLPKTFASFPSTTTQAGITLRFNLSNF